MTAPTSLRRLNREARQQQRMKARIAAWWHVERRPRETGLSHLQRDGLPLGLRPLFADSLHAPASPALTDRDDTPKH